MISSEMRHLIETGSGIRKMWSDGMRLKEIHGAENVADMTLGNPVLPVPDALREALVDIASHPPEGLHRYTPNAGHPGVRARVAAHLDGAGYLPGATAAHVVMTAGASAATNIALRAILDPGDEVVILAPYFPDYPPHVLNHRGVPVTVTTDSEFLPDLEVIERAVGPRTRAVVINHPNNPSGKEYPVERLVALADLLSRASRKHGRPIYLLSDEPYREIRFVEEPFVSPAAVHEYGLMAYSFSKSHSIPGERIGYLAVNPSCPDQVELLAALSLANRILGFTNAPSLWQHVIVRCLDAVVDLGVYRRHRDRLTAALLEKGYSVPDTQGTFYLFPVTPGGDDEVFMRRAMEELLLLVPGGTFGAPGRFRLAFCVDDRTVDQAIDRLPMANAVGGGA